MSLPDTASLEAFSLAELRDVVGRLVGEVRRLHLDNASLQARVDVQQATITVLRTENQALRDEVARLKGLPPRPPSRPSGMEQATQPGTADADETRPKLPRGVKRDAQAVTAERVLKVAVPAGSRFKGYEDILVRDLRLSAEVVRYRRERWLLQSGETVVAALPAGIVGGFGPELRRFVLALHAQGQVTTERLTALLNGIGVEISKRQVVRLLAEPLDGFVAEDQEVLRAGLATARWVTVDDTAARHARKDGFTTQIGDDRFAVFRTGASKSREAFLSVLRAGHTDYVVNAAALSTALQLWFSRTSRAVVSFSKAHSVDFARVFDPLRPSCQGLPTAQCKPRFFQSLSNVYVTHNRNDSTGSAGEPECRRH